MRFVTPKTESQQTLSVLHWMRESLVRDRTRTANQMHGFLSEFGVSLPRGLAIMKRLAVVLAEHELPVRLTVLLQRLHNHSLPIWMSKSRQWIKSWHANWPTMIWEVVC